MSKVKSSGFLTALIIAVVSFFVIAIFFQDFSEEVFGVRFNKKKVESQVENTVEKASETAQDAIKLIKKTTKEL